MRVSTWASAARWLLLGVAAGLLAACASPYGPSGLIGGYRDEKIGDNVYKVSFSGNGYTNEDMVVKYWLNRCAELTVKNGYTFFGLVRGSDKSSLTEHGEEDFRMMTDRDRIQSLAHPAVFRPSDHGGGMTQVRSAQTYIWVPSYGGKVTTWSKTGTIVMFHSRIGFRPEQAHSLHARTVLEMLKPFVESAGKVAGPSRQEVIDAALNLSPVPAGAPITP